MMNVQVLYFDGCPNHESTVKLVREVISDLGLVARVEEVEVKDSEDAERLRFFGSPTVHVDGEDIEPEARTKTNYSFSCRVYGRSGTPPRALLEAALRDTA